MSRAIGALISAVLIFLAALLGWTLIGDDQAVVRFSTGSPSGMYHRVSQLLGQATFGDRDERFALLDSSGSQQNVSRLENGDAEVAIIQNDAVAGGSLRSLAALYPEVLHLVCRKECEIKSLNDLAGKRVDLGDKQSGTFQLVSELLRFARIQLGEQNVSNHSFDATAAMFAEDELDAAFYLVGIGSASIQNLLSSEQLELVPIQIHSPDRDDVLVDTQNFVDGFRVAYPHASFFEIPLMTYAGRPRRPIESVGVQAVLVATESLPADVAGSLVETLFAKRASLGRQLPIMSRLDESRATSQLQFPLHVGAESYYQRNQPGFLAENAESIGLIVTLVLLLISAAASLHRWYQQSRKNHVDTYYAKIHAILDRLGDDSNPAELQAIESELNGIERAACAELIDERLDADESYLILQNMLQFAADQIKRQPNYPG